MVAIIALLSLLFVYEKEVKAAILNELNKHLKVEVKVDPNNIDSTYGTNHDHPSIACKNSAYLNNGSIVFHHARQR